MKLAAVIVNYRTAELTAAVIATSLPELAAAGTFHLYVVDNCSGDGSFDTLNAAVAAAGWGDSVTVIAAPRNGGYGYGINVAVDAARRRPDPPTYLLVVNSDAFPQPGSVKEMLDFMDQTPDAGLCGANIQGTDGAPQASAFRFPSAITELNDTAKTALVSWILSDSDVALPLPPGPLAVDWISGTCMMIRWAVFDQVGVFDEGFFLYFEEVDFCRRAGKAGWRSYCLPSARVKHLGSVSTGMGDPSRRVPGYWFESRHRYFQKAHGRSYAVAADVCWMAGFVIGEAKRSLLRRPRTAPPDMLKDFIHNSFRALTGPRMRGAHAAADVPGAEPVVPTWGSEGPGGPSTAPHPDARPASELGTVELLAEDFATYDRRLMEPGLWAVVAHRLGTKALAIESGPVRLALDVAYATMFTGVDWIWGIHLPRSVELGRRVRLWHNGCMLLTARSIGNDVHIRHDTTFGSLRSLRRGEEDPHGLPVIEDRADIGSGACVLGGVRVGHDAVIGANSVVLKNVAPNSTVLGVPARLVPG